MILPYIEQNALYDQIDFNICSYTGVNGTVSQAKVAAFLCPTDGPYANLSYGGINYKVCGGSSREFYNDNSTRPVPGKRRFHAVPRNRDGRNPRRNLEHDHAWGAS